jgi:2-keto-4-pentenoate hydratase/2-oxohepta-3-ene-1,7-dioic acid hydratase in catechol pathway
MLAAANSSDTLAPSYVCPQPLTIYSDLIFSIPKLVSFLSQGTTLPAGTVIITGTPAGVGMGKNPKENLQAGDEFRVEILPHIGTLVNTFENEE